jgi:hypothetical protein
VLGVACANDYVRTFELFALFQMDNGVAELEAAFECLPLLTLPALPPVCAARE